MVRRATARGARRSERRDSARDRKESAPRRAGLVWLEELGQPIRRNGLAEKVSLGFVTIVFPQKLQIFSRFNSLSNDAEVKAAAHVDECSDGGRSTGNGGDLADNRPVDLGL